MKMKHRLSSCGSVVLLGLSLLAAPAAHAQDAKVSVYAGYAFLKSDDGNMNGLRLSPEYHLNGFASVVGDLSYEKGSPSSGSSHITTYLGGVRLRRGLGSISVFAHALAGGVKSETSVKPFGGVTISVAETGLGLDGGGGVEFKVGGHLKLRAGADYLRHKVSDVNVSDIRATVGLVF